MINFVHKNGQHAMVSQKHVLRSTIYVESLMGLYKSAQFLIVALYYIVHHAVVVVVHCVYYMSLVCTRPIKE